MSRHFLYLTNSRLVSIATQGRRIAMRREFALPGAGLAEIERHLAGLEPMETNVLTDLAEEDFRLDTVPHVRGGDREAIFARKLQQIFRSTPFRHALLQGREPEGRRDDRVVYTAITNPEMLRGLLEVIDRLKVPLAGVHSVAIFSAALLEELDLAFPHTLLVTFTPGEAIRQTYFRNGEIRFSRLTPVDLKGGQTLGAMVAEETTRTWQYLDSLRHFAADDRLEVCVLMHPRDLESVKAELRNFAQIEYQIVDAEIAAAKLGMKPPPSGSSAEEVFVHLFHLRPAANHYATAEQRRHSTLRFARATLLRISAGLVAASLAGAGWFLAGAWQVNQTDDVLRRQLAGIKQETERIARETPSFGVGGSTMRDTVAFFNHAMKDYPTPGAFLRPVSVALREHPRIQVMQVAWLATDDEKASPGLGRSVMDSPTQPVRSLPKPLEGSAVPAPAPAPAQASDEANPSFKGSRYQVALIEGALLARANDFRGTLAEVERLLADIERAPGFRATIVESPLDVRSAVGLQGRLDDRQPTQMATRFVIRVIYDRGGAA